MKAIFVYSNNKTFTAKHVIEDSISVERHKDESGKVAAVLVSYQAHRFISGDAIADALKAVLKVPNESDSGITTSFDADDILYGVEGLQTFEIDAVAAGLNYIIVVGDSDDDCVIETASDFNNDEENGIVIIQVCEKLTPEMVADALLLGL